MTIKHWINGRYQDSSQHFLTLNPASQAPLAEVARGEHHDVAAAVAAAKAAFQGWSATAPARRSQIMRKLGDLIARHAPEIASVETKDTGQVISQTAKQLIPRAADNFYYFA
ncbi:MAG: aldehyde dehydrogenase family protein, partial [Betaproteobacteria bacterium]|nr:aldehyde dehydrogenase family protein [Betaproteobacteria bacterium]